MVEWRYPRNGKRTVQFQQVGGKEFVFAKDARGSIEDPFMASAKLLPLFDHRNAIIGTQLIFDAQKPKIYYFSNESEGYPDGIPEHPLMEKLGYKLYRHACTGDYQAVLAYATIKRDVVADRRNRLSSRELRYIIEA